MSDPINHHFLPKFYLNAWSNAEGNVLEYRRPYVRIAQKYRHPSATGYIPELYAIPSRPDPALRQEVERLFMAYVDTQAAAALERLLSSPGEPLTPRLRDGWTRFLMSLIHRTPRRIEWLLNKLREKEHEAMVSIHRRYQKLRGDTHPETFEDFWDGSQASTVFDETFALLLKQLIDSVHVGTAINGMQWSFGTLRGHSFTFLTSDAPVILSKGFGGPDGFLMLPISPDTVFVAANRAEVISRFLTAKSDVLARAVNDAVVRRAQDLVVASDERHEVFIDNRFGRSAIKPPVSHFMGIPVWQEPCDF